MKTMISAFRRGAKYSPLILTLGDKQIMIYADWDRSTTKQINLIIKADMEVDILIPSTFNKLKDKINALEEEIKSLKHV